MAQSLEWHLGVMAPSSYNHSRQLLERELKTRSIPLYLFGGSLDPWGRLKETALRDLSSKNRQLFWFGIAKKLLIISSFPQVKFKFPVVMSCWRFFSTGNPITNLFALIILSSVSSVFRNSASLTNQNDNSCLVATEETRQ